MLEKNPVLWRGGAGRGLLCVLTTRQLHFVGIINNEIFAIIKKLDLPAIKAKLMEESARLWEYCDENYMDLPEQEDCLSERFEEVSRKLTRLDLLALPFLCF